MSDITIVCSICGSSWNANSIGFIENTIADEERKQVFLDTGKYICPFCQDTLEFEMMKDD